MSSAKWRLSCPGASVTPCMIECYSNLKSDANIVWHKPCQNRPDARNISQIPVRFWHIMGYLLIFEIYIRKAVERMGRSGLGIEIGGVTVSALIFADDIVLCGGSEIELSQLLEFIWQELDELGLKMGKRVWCYQWGNGEKRESDGGEE